MKKAALKSAEKARKELAAQKKAAREEDAEAEVVEDVEEEEVGEVEYEDECKLASKLYRFLSDRKKNSSDVANIYYQHLAKSWLATHFQTDMGTLDVVKLAAAMQSAELDIENYKSQDTQIVSAARSCAALAGALWSKTDLEEWEGKQKKRKAT